MGKRYCKYCGAVILDKYNKLCSKCENVEKQTLSRIKNHLKYNSTATIEQISKKTGVDIRQINKYIREGRISVALNCSSCGKIISSADSRNLCEKCKRSVFNQIKFSMKFKKS